MNQENNNNFNENFNNNNFTNQEVTNPQQTFYNNQNNEPIQQSPNTPPKKKSPVPIIIVVVVLVIGTLALIFGKKLINSDSSNNSYNGDSYSNSSESDEYESTTKTNKTNYVNPNAYKGENACTYDGVVEKSTEFEKGNYIYRYGTYKPNDGNYLANIPEENMGWSVRYINTKSTEPITEAPCTSINGIPVTYMTAMFLFSKASSIDLSHFNTSNVVNMDSMFYGTETTSLDLSSFDTSNVTSMNKMFTYANANVLDLSYFNTSKVKYMDSMFFSCKASKIVLTNFDTSNVHSMEDMFNTVLNVEKLDLSNFTSESVINLSYTFANSSFKTIDLSNFEFTDMSTTCLNWTTFDDSDLEILYVPSKKDINKIKENYAEQKKTPNFKITTK